MCEGVATQCIFKTFVFRFMNLTAPVLTWPYEIAQRALSKFTHCIMIFNILLS